MNSPERVEQALKTAKASLPPEVVDLRHELDIDSTGVDCVRVWLILDDASPEEVWAFASTSAMRETVKRALRDAEVDLWPYILVRAKSEQDAFDAEAAVGR